MIHAHKSLGALPKVDELAAPDLQAMYKLVQTQTGNIQHATTRKISHITHGKM